jgi:phosphoheptose isomerase
LIVSLATICKTVVLSGRGFSKLNAKRCGSRLHGRYGLDRHATPSTMRDAQSISMSLKSVPCGG